MNGYYEEIKSERDAFLGRAMESRRKLETSGYFEQVAASPEPSIHCEHCGLSRECVEMSAAVAGITDPICCEVL